VHLTGIALISCFIAPMMRFAAGTVNRAFGIKEDILAENLGRESGVSDVFYCHGMIGVLVMLCLQQIVYRKEFYFDSAMHYISILGEEDKARIVSMILNESQEFPVFIPSK